MRTQIFAALIAVAALAGCQTANDNYINYNYVNSVADEDVILQPENGWLTRSDIVYKSRDISGIKNIRSFLTGNGFKRFEGEALKQLTQGNTLELRYSQALVHPMWLYYADMSRIKYAIVGSGNNRFWGPEVRGIKYTDVSVCSVRINANATLCIDVFARTSNGKGEMLCVSHQTNTIKPCVVKQGDAVPLNK